MSELQAIIEFSIELHKFVNVDLFQRGFYQVRVSLKVNTKNQHKVEISFGDSSSRPSSSSSQSQSQSQSSASASSKTKSASQSQPSSPSISSSSPSSQGSSSSMNSSSSQSTSNIVFPPCIVNGAAVSKTFQIMYKSEEVLLNDVVSFKTHLIVDPNQCISQVNSSQFILDVELWFTDQNFGPDHHNSIECVSTRQLILHVDLLRGLHYHLPILFDYFHLASLTLSIHASLTTLCQPFLTHRGSAKGEKKFGANAHTQLMTNSSLGYENLLFGSRNNDAVNGSSSSPINNKNANSDSNADVNDDRENITKSRLIQLHKAQLIHWQLASIMLTAINNLKRIMDEYVHLMPPWQQVKYNNINCSPAIENLSKLAQECFKSCQNMNDQTRNHPNSHSKHFIAYQNETSFSAIAFDDDKASFIKQEDFIANVESDMAYLCGSAILLWQEFTKIILHSERIVMHLSKVHHLQRVKRFSEGFFSLELPRRQMHSICDNSNFVFSEISELLRKSQYFQLLPPCDVDCVALDGDATSLPIIFEEKFDADHPSSSNNANISDISLEEALEKILRSQENSLTMKRNIREKLMHNLSKLHLGGHAKSNREECYSPVNVNSNRSLSSINLRSTSNCKTDTTSIKSSIALRTNMTAPNMHLTRESVTLLGFKRFDNLNSNNKVNSGKNCYKINSSVNNYDTSDNHNKMGTNMMSSSISNSNLQSQAGTSLSSSESMPDLSKRNNAILNQLKQQIPSLVKKSSVMIEEEEGGKSNCGEAEGKEEVVTAIVKPIAAARRIKNDASNQIEPPVEFRDDVKHKYQVSNKKMKSQKERRKEEKGDLQNFAAKELTMKKDSNHDKVSSGKGFVTPSLTFTKNDGKNEQNDETSTGNPISVINSEQQESTRQASRSHLFESIQSRNIKGITGSDEMKCENDGKCTILELLKSNEECVQCGGNMTNCDCSQEYDDLIPSVRRLSQIDSDLVSFIRAKEDFRQTIASKGMAKGCLFYSDFPSLASRIPYFQCDPELRAFSPEGLHLIICVHGLDGNSADLRLVKTYLELGLPTTNFEFLMSQRNQGETFECFETLTDRLVEEIINHIDVYGLNPTKISFIGHSLGNIIIRAALARPQMKSWLTKLHTFLSLSGPHLGTAYNNSGLVNMGLWFMQKWKKSGSLLQLAMKDASDARQTYLYRLSLEPGLEYFRHILLCGSSQDHYVPIHSAHIELCNAALNDSSLNGIAYREMVSNLLHPIMSKSSIKLIRYDVHHSLGSNANTLIGRAAHIAVLDSELFIEKFLVVAGLKYFV